MHYDAPGRAHTSITYSSMHTGAVTTSLTQNMENKYLASIAAYSRRCVQIKAQTAAAQPGLAATLLKQHAPCLGLEIVSPDDEQDPAHQAHQHLSSHHPAECGHERNNVVNRANDNGQLQTRAQLRSPARCITACAEEARLRIQHGKVHTRFSILQS